MSNERFPRRVDLAIWTAGLAFWGLALHEALAVAPAPRVAPRAAQVVAAPAPAGGVAATSATPRQTWQRECGDCHLAYPAQLLPAADWRRIVGALDRHFGVDATLDPATSAAIGSWLEANAAQPRGAEVRSTAAAGNALAPLPRISTTAWFRHEHDEIGASTWKRAAIGSAARCEACHTDAAQGRFSEHALRIPR